MRAFNQHWDILVNSWFNKQYLSRPDRVLGSFESAPGRTPHLHTTNKMMNKQVTMLIVGALLALAGLAKADTSSSWPKLSKSFGKYISDKVSASLLTKGADYLWSAVQNKTKYEDVATGEL